MAVPPPDETRQPGQQVTMVVRLDSIKLSLDLADSPFQGVVKRSTYLGSQVEYGIEIAGQTLVAVESDPRRVIVIPSGTPVAVRFLAEALYVFP